MHTAVGKKPEQMRAMATSASQRFLHHLVACQFAVRDRFVNSGQVLINNPPSTQVKMSNFRIAHLPIRQTNIGPAGAQFTAWIIPIELVVKRRPREERCVSIFFALLPTARINAAASCWRFSVFSPLPGSVSFISNTGSFGNLSELFCSLERDSTRGVLLRHAPTPAARARV